MSWNLSIPAQAGQNVNLRVIAQDLEYKWALKRGEFDVEGRKNTVIRSDVRKGLRFTLVVRTKGNTAAGDLEDILTTPYVLRLVDVTGRVLDVKALDVAPKLIHTAWVATNPTREYTIEFVETDPDELGV